MKLKPIFDVHVLFVAWLIHLSNCTFQFLCPDISFLGLSAQLNCSTSKPLTSLLYEGPGTLRAPACEASFSACTTVKGFKASFINATHTSLRILNVEPQHAGTWTCTEGATSESASCGVQVAKTPTCSITSKEDTDVLAQYQALTLTVAIQDYYCSTALTFSLQTGNVTKLLMEADSVASVTDNTSSVTLNVTDSHLGVVGLVFSCHNYKSNLTCEGVTKLAPKTPTCNITSDKDTETLTLYEELTLTVGIAAYYDIRGSYCSVDSNFTLQTGDVRQLLNVAGTGSDNDLSPITFNVTETHLGGVRLIFNCQHKHWNLTCEKVGEFNNKTKTATVPENDGLATDSTPIIAAGVVGAIVFVIIVVIIFVFVVKRKQVTGSSNTHTYEYDDVTVNGKRRVAAGYPSSDGTVHQAEDNVLVGSGGSPSGNQQEPGLRINPVYIPTTVGGSLESYNGTVPTGTSTETGVMGGDYLHPEAMGNYLALDRNAVQPTNIYEHLRIYEQIASM